MAARRRPLVYVPDAKVAHLKQLSFRGFCRQHFLYGKGAFHFHRARRARNSGRFRAEFLVYYVRVFRAAFTPTPSAVLAKLLLLLTWQVMNTAGFCRRCCLTSARERNRERVMTSPISVAVIGCGYAAEMHLPAIRSLKQARLTALADSDPTRLQTVANRYGIERRYLDWRELVHDRANQVIAVLTPPHLHYEMTLAAVRAGKHVLVEKPLVADLAQADRLIEETLSSPARITIGYNLRFHRQIRELCGLIQEGALGNIEFVRGVATSPTALRDNFPNYRKKRELGGGGLIELAVHYYDLWEHLLGTRLQHVTAMSRSAEGDDMTAFVAGRMASGVLVSAEFSLKATEQHEIDVYGDRARAKASLYRFDGLQVFPLGTYEGGIGHRLRHLYDAAVRLPQAVRAAPAGGIFLESFREQWRCFLDCIRCDRAVYPNLIDGRQSLAIALAVVRAADTGRTIRLDEEGRDAGPGE